MDAFEATLDQHRCKATTTHVPAQVGRARCQLYQEHESAHAICWRDQDGRRIVRTWLENVSGYVDVRPGPWGELPIKFAWSPGAAAVWDEPRIVRQPSAATGLSRRRRR